MTSVVTLVLWDTSDDTLGLHGKEKLHAVQHKVIYFILNKLMFEKITVGAQSLVYYFLMNLFIYLFFF